MPPPRRRRRGSPRGSARARRSTLLPAGRPQRRVADEEQHAAQVDEQLHHRLFPQASARMSENAVRPSSTAALSPAASAVLLSSTDDSSASARPPAAAGEVAGDLALEHARSSRISRTSSRGGLEHPRAAVGLDLDKAVALQADQRLAHGVFETPRSSAIRASTSCSPAGAHPRRSRRAAARRRGARAGPGGSSRALRPSLSYIVSRPRRRRA